jgi:hypothetical protein
MNQDHFADTQWEDVVARASQEPSEPADELWTTEAVFGAYND